MMHSYYFSMLLDGSAYTWDATWPVDLNHYFVAHPGYMKLPSNQGQQYLTNLRDQALDRQFSNKTTEVMRLSPDVDYLQQFRSEADASAKITILQTTRWHVDTWTTLSSSPSMNQLRGKYRLNELAQSEWFWIMHRLLLNPNDWLSSKLLPFERLMGGSVKYGESVSAMEAGNQVHVDVARDWFRLGLRLVDSTALDDKQLDCLWHQVRHLCDVSDKKEYHVYLASTSASLLQRFKKRLPKKTQPSSPSFTLHTLPDTFPFVSWDTSSSTAVGKPLFGVSEDQLKATYARPLMDWLILSRMDYLVGMDQDPDIMTAAWAAQVQTDLLAQHSCQFLPMTTW
ncbi:hypothetical protein DM01DRAFT_1335386 [Hesseltinella vesiculosa]|uniref:Uncharacterized protein n=1 Tax=Hesseltinella vesiculosa TaxID=101127 RepID=A0A1X2GJ76_9FUNG|nr:hypothetical protein DM01DRAFT_1335386 [Hesseltinella vesiculosa]